MPWCGHIDYPCCGCDGNAELGIGPLGPESAGDFLGRMEEEGDFEGLEFAERYMTPCPKCGEMRPKDDESLRNHGMCWMCVENPERADSPVAQENLAFFSDKLADVREENQELRQRVQVLEARLKGDDHEG